MLSVGFLEGDLRKGIGPAVLGWQRCPGLLMLCFVVATYPRTMKVWYKIAQLFLMPMQPVVPTAQVYVTVYSDGPTRVLRFSDEPNITSSQAEQSILDLAARLKQVRVIVRLHSDPAVRAELADLPLTLHPLPTGARCCCYPDCSLGDACGKELVELGMISLPAANSWNRDSSWRAYTS